MPPKPSAAASRSVSTGKTSSSSHCRANGIIAPRAKARAVSLIARCSSVRSKSMMATDNGSAFDRQSSSGQSRSATPLSIRQQRWPRRRSGATASSEQPRTRIRNRFVVIERQRAFDVAHERPDKPPEQHGDPDDRGGQDYSNCKIQEPDPECANLKPVMRAQQRVGGGKLDMRDDDADEGRYSREVGDEVEDIDDQRELPAGHRGLLRRIGSWSRHRRASPRMTGPSWHGNRCDGNPRPPSRWYDFAVQARSR